MTIIFLHEGDDDDDYDNGDDVDNNNDDEVASEFEAIDHLDSIGFDIDNADAFYNVKCFRRC